MTPIIQQALDDGVVMTLTVTGQIEVTGDPISVEKWLPAIREAKHDIVAALQDDPAVKAIKAWLVHIGEADPVMVEETLQRCTSDPETLAYFLWRAQEIPTNQQ